MFKAKIIVLFVSVAVIVTLGIVFITKSLDQLTSTARQATLPDEGLNELKDLVADVNNAESGVRAFAITQDQKYLEPYYNILNEVDYKGDSLRQLFAGKSQYIDSIHSLLKSKLSIYNELIDVRYNNLISQAIEKTSGIENVKAIIPAQPVDSMVPEPVKRNFFQKLFGSKRKEELELKARELDSLKILQAEQDQNLQKKFRNIRIEDSRKIQTISAKELELLSNNKIISARIEETLKKFENLMSFEKKLKAENIIRQTDKDRKQLTIITAAGAALIVLLVVLLLFDIRRNDRFKKQIIEERNRAEKLAKFKEEFLANMSHEIRTPVSALSGFSSRLLKTNLTGEQAEYVKNIVASSDHLLNIINDILDVSSLETGKLKLEKSVFSVYEAAKEVCNLLTVKAFEKNVELIYQGQEIKNIQVKGDSLRLKQILFNVAGNAVKFTEHGNIKISVHCIGSIAAGQPAVFRFQISDSGIGIPKEKLQAIFQPFEQADMSITRKYGGTGLGLSITKKIIDLHGGKISVESEAGRGSTFIIEIPYEIAEQKPKIYEPQIKSARPLKGIKVLIAEDDELNRILEQMMLNDLGAEADAVSNGEEALFNLQTKKYDIVLMDLQMPEMGGVEAAKKIRSDLKSNIPVIAVTANIHHTGNKKEEEHGINCTILKPFTEEQITAEILRLVNNADQQTGKKVLDSNDIVKPYNLSTLEKASNNNPDFVARMLKVFCMSGKSLFQKAEEGFVAGDREKIAAAVHRLIPSCRQLEINSLATDLKKTENLCEEQSNMNTIADSLKSCRLMFDNIVVYIEKEIASLEKTKA